MSQRERRNRKDEAAAASARFAEVMDLITHRAQLVVAGPRMLADAADRWELDPLEVLAFERRLAEDVAGLTRRIDAYRADGRVMTLMHAAHALNESLASGD